MSLRVRLVLASMLMLLVELALIRWLGANLIYLGYFSNFVLLGSFLGIGVGFLRARNPRDLTRFAPVALVLLVGLVLAFPIEVQRDFSGNLIYVGGQLIGWHSPVLSGWLVLPVVFLAVATVMGLIAEIVARTFVKLPPLEAYRMDITGSLLGIATFSLFALVNGPSLYWGILASALVILLTWSKGRIAWTALPVVGLVVCLFIESYDLGYIWSPYYKIAVVNTTNSSCQPLPTNVNGCPLYSIYVNGIPHQGIESVQTLREEGALVLAPFEHRTSTAPINNVLIIGAGNGKDVAAALAFGAKHVDAVEIDPQLYQIGVQLNPDHPYQDPRVTAYINDGRAFLEQSNKSYDLILFSQTDSLTLVLGQGSLRLESYLFTQQAMESALKHLAPGGIVGLYNVYWQQWYLDRLANTLEVVYGNAPCIDVVPQPGTIAAMTVSSNPASLTCPARWQSPAAVEPPAQDDRPFPYLQGNSIPSVDLVALPLILLAALLAARVFGGGLRRMTTFGDLFFMGAAFLLLETKSIVQFALLFGTTWFVNALVFAGVLAAVYLAIEISRLVRIQRIGRMYVLLTALLAVAWVVPLDSLLSLTFWPRLLLGSAITFAPILIANLVFAQRFRDTGDSTTAFAANLLGAMVGGTLEYLSLITGYRFLLAVVALLYAAAFITGRSKLLSKAVGT